MFHAAATGAKKRDDAANSGPPAGYRRERRFSWGMGGKVQADLTSDQRRQQALHHLTPTEKNRSGHDPSPQSRARGAGLASAAAAQADARRHSGGGPEDPESLQEVLYEANHAAMTTEQARIDRERVEKRQRMRQMRANSACVLEEGGGGFSGFARQLQNRILARFGYGSGANHPANAMGNKGWSWWLRRKCRSHGRANKSARTR